jgi:hypothetical protein
VILGPQRHRPIVRPTVELLLGRDRSGPIALVSAGWEERELEDAEFREHLQRPVVNLEIWSRVERIFAADPGLLEAMRRRHDTLRQVQELYRLRLSGLVTAASTLLRRVGDSALLDPEREGSLAMLQQLDRSHVERVAAIHAEFEAQVRPTERDPVASHRRELRGLLREAGCLCIAGGHVGVLLHRLRLFDLLGLAAGQPIVAWSAGAMVLTQRIVLFHDRQEQPGTEVMEAGFGLLPGFVALPHASSRLRLDDREHVQLLARRFAPALCVALDDHSRVDWDGRRFSAPPGTMRLGADGSVAEVGA